MPCVSGIERETALTYQRLADNVLAGLERAFARHPVMRLRDTIRAHIGESEGLVSSTRVTISETNDILTNEVARLRAAGVRFRNDIVTGPGGSQILLIDPSGNLVELFQPAPR